MGGGEAGKTEAMCCTNGKDTRECRECGASLAGRHHRTKFCDSGCKEAFNSRRWSRGTEIYDFVMAWRYEREHQKETLTTVTALLRSYRDEDQKSRDGRKSWFPYEEAMAKLDRLAGVADGR
jgi:hypothetical protein